jgi:hypothetical protein
MANTQYAEMLRTYATMFQEEFEREVCQDSGLVRRNMIMYWNIFAAEKTDISADQFVGLNGYRLVENTDKLDEPVRSALEMLAFEHHLMQWDASEIVNVSNIGTALHQLALADAQRTYLPKTESPK